MVRAQELLQQVHPVAVIPFLNRAIRDTNNAGLGVAFVEHEPACALLIEIHFRGIALPHSFREADEDAVVLLGAGINMKGKVRGLARGTIHGNIYADVFPRVFWICRIVGIAAQNVCFKDATLGLAISVPFHKSVGPIFAGVLGLCVFTLGQRA